MFSSHSLHSYLPRCLFVPINNALETENNKDKWLWPFKRTVKHLPPVGRGSTEVSVFPAHPLLWHYLVGAVDELPVEQERPGQTQTMCWFRRRSARSSAAGHKLERRAKTEGWETEQIQATNSWERAACPPDHHSLQHNEGKGKNGKGIENLIKWYMLVKASVKIGWEPTHCMTLKFSAIQDSSRCFFFVV